MHTTTENKTTRKKQDAVLHFSPALQCEEKGCERLTTWATLNYGFADPFAPQCWEHAYVPAEVYGEKAVRAAIRRFLAGYYGQPNRGQFGVIGRCELSEVPNYEAWEDMDRWLPDEAWKCRVLDNQGKHVVYVVQCHYYFRFELYTEGD
jgi:hypothetical protein